MGEKYVGIIPPYSKKNIERIKKNILINKDLVPNYKFTFIDYYNILLRLEMNIYNNDVLLVYRLFDEHYPTQNNICVLTYEMRKKQKDTIPIISFNESNLLINKKDVGMNRLYLDKLLESDFNGIVLTSSLDDAFLLNLIRDVLGYPKAYLDKKIKIESQKDFLVYPPEHTELGIRFGM